LICSAHSKGAPISARDEWKSVAFATDELLRSIGTNFKIAIEFVAIIATFAALASSSLVLQIAAAVTLAILVSAIIYGVRKSLRQPFDFRAKEDVFSWRITEPDGSRCIHTLHRKVKVLRDEFDIAVSEYGGKGDVNAEKGFAFKFKDGDENWKDAIVIGPVEKDSLRPPDKFEKVFVYFSHTFSAGDATEFEVTRILHDHFPEKRNEWVSFKCARPTKRATLRVYFHDDRRPESAVRCIGDEGSDGKWPARIVQADKANDFCPMVEWKITKPKRNQVYQIHWVWPDLPVAGPTPTE
jgi:hypothetical protein